MSNGGCLFNLVYVNRYTAKPKRPVSLMSAKIRIQMVKPKSESFPMKRHKCVTVIKWQHRSHQRRVKPSCKDNESRCRVPLIMFRSSSYRSLVEDHIISFIVIHEAKELSRAEEWPMAKERSWNWEWPSSRRWTRPGCGKQPGERRE